MNSHLSKKSLLSYLVITSLVLPPSSGYSPTYHFCHEASMKDPNFTIDFCLACLEPSFKSRSPVTMDDMVSVSLELAMLNATRIGSIVGKLLNESDTSSESYHRQALSDCFNLYSTALSSLRVARDDVKAKDYFKANIDISATMNAPTTCEDGFKEKKGEVSPLTKENMCFFNLTAMVLTFVAMLN